MPIRPSVFGSPRERRLFKALDSRWGTEFNLYPGLKFHNIVDLEGHSLTSDERTFLFATEVDYTLCDHEDRPLVSIEFDGLTGGLSRDGRFIPRKPGLPGLRARKFDLKLRVAEEAGYPLTVVSSDEAAGLPGTDAPMIVDGIIGQALARWQAHQEIAGLSDVLPEETDGMSEVERYDYIQDRVLDIELLAEFRHDPIARLASELQKKLSETGCYRGGSGQRFLEDESVPKLSEDRFPMTPMEYAELLRSRSAALSSAPRHGSEATITTTIGTFRATAWIRNFGIDAGCLTLVENIAKVRALRKALRAMEKTQGKARG